MVQLFGNIFIYQVEKETFARKRDVFFITKSTFLIKKVYLNLETKISNVLLSKCK